MIQIGQKFPDFHLANQDGKSRSLKDYSGKWLVLYVYPKDDTPGCTIQGKSFTAQKAEFEAGPPRRVEPYRDIVARITAPVIGIWGEDDFVVSMNDVRQLRGILEDTRKTYEFTLFRDMPHGWMNDTMPGRYRPKETEMAWKLILDFIERVHAGAFPKDRMIWRFESDAAVSYDFTKKVRLA